MISFIVLVLSASLSINALPLSEDKLVAVSLLYRHGDRTIITTYPNDPYQNVSFWPAPYGELINKGKQRHYSLGKWLRTRYDSFLSRKYLAKEFLLTSSNYDRCLMSAASNLAGLYPPEGDQVWNQELLWQPIPIHTTPNSLDGMLALNAPCPEFSELLQVYLQTEPMLQLAIQNENLYAYLSEKTGTKINTLQLAADLYDTLLVENLSNYTLPEWSKEVFPEKLEILSIEHFKVETSTPEMAKFRVGQYFNDILNQFDSFVYGNASDQKFKAFSAHDTNVFNVLHSLKIPNLTLVPYAGMILFELRQDPSGGYYVQFSYKTDDEIQQLTIEGCTENCKYEEFRTIIGELSLSRNEWEEACKLS